MINPEKRRDAHLTALRLETPRLKLYDDYFEGEQPLRYIAPEVRQEIGDRVTELAINIPRFGVEAYDHRLDIEGFRFVGSDSSDDELWKVFEANDGPLLSQQVHEETLALGRAAAIVGEGDKDVPLITIESPFETIYSLDPRTHDVASGIKTWADEDGVRWVNLYHPDGRITWRRDKREWVEDSSVETGYGLCQLVPLVNQPRTLGRPRPGRPDQRLGRSVFHSIIPVADAVNKMATDMMVSGEFHAMPRRWAVGLTENDFMDENGQPLDTFSLIAGAIWTSENKDTKMGQFPEADLGVFHNSIKLLFQIASNLLALPPHYLGFTGQNPASADAIRSSEIALVKRAERLQRSLGGRWERVQRLVLLTMGRPDSPEAKQIETLWRDPSTPTVAQKADAAVKLVGAKDGRGHSIIDSEQAREDLGYTPTQRDRLAERDALAAEDPQIQQALRTLDTAGAADSVG
jgi:hypothetical protein